MPLFDFSEERKMIINKNIRKLFVMIYVLRQPTSVFLPGKTHGERSVVGYSPWGSQKLDMTQWLNNNNFLKEKIWKKHNNMLTFVKFGWYLNGFQRQYFLCPFKFFFVFFPPFIIKVLYIYIFPLASWSCFLGAKNSLYLEINAWFISQALLLDSCVAMANLLSFTRKCND